ncbi:MAG: hypothetical protein AAFN77_03915 [Planctomycetota bacterium]
MARFKIRPFWFVSGTAAILVMAVCLDSARAYQAEINSYQALISTPEATVRSGPGSVHYGTLKLERGDSVEVFRHDPGGWCAVRPPEGSFSMVPESTIKIVREGVGEVAIEDARAWVGTRLGPVEKPLWQVKLRKGELVSVIGEMSYPNPEGYSTVWYQIKSPPGEFRWIKIDELEPLYGELPEPDREPAETHTSARPAANQPDGPNEVQRAPQREAPSENIRQSKPQPDLNTRDDRVIGSALRAGRTESTSPLDSASRLTPPSPRPQQIRQLDSTREPSRISSSNAIDVPSSLAARISPNVVRADFDSNSSGDSVDEPVRLIAAQQDVVLPQNQEGVNQGWRPSRRALGDRQNVSSNSEPSSVGDTASRWRDAPADNFSAAATPNWNQTNNSTDTSQSPGNLNRTDRFADATQNDTVLANQLQLARLAPIPGSYREMTATIVQLESELTREMINGDPSTWNLDPLVFRARQLRQSTTTPQQQINLDRLLLKMQNCQQLRAQFGSDASSSANATPLNGLSAVRANSDSGSGFDATGWLNELKRDQGTLRSTYVLQDANGKITHHIEATPGLNLDRYLKKKVGVIGQRGYHQRLKLDHVLVTRVFGL